LFVDFLEAHRIKTIGFLELGIKTGRTESSGQAAAALDWQTRVWRKADEDFKVAMSEQEQLQIMPESRGFTKAFVESITEWAPGSESNRVVFNIAGGNIHYRAGDRVEILPRNGADLIARTLDILGCNWGLNVGISSTE